MFHLKNYRQTIILLLSMVLGVIVGLSWKEKAQVLAPLGDLFLNLLVVVIPPLIFLTISTSIAKITTPKRLGKILLTILLIIIITSIVAAAFGILVTYQTKLVSTDESSLITKTFKNENTDAKETSINYLNDMISLISVDDFNKLLTRQNIVAITIFAILFGFSLKLTGETAFPLLRILNATTSVMMQYLHLVFYYAPIGIFSYIAALVGSYGSSIAIGYLKTFVIYYVCSIFFYFVIYTLYAFIAGGKKGCKRFWNNILPVTLTALATCSSAASIPANILTAKKIGVADDIAEPLIPLATTFHKDGSIIGSVFKTMFLVSLFSIQASFWEIIGIALISALFVTAVPIGGGVISETLIISMLGCPISALGSLTIIATIIDAPATVLNVVGDTTSAMLAARMIDGKNWMVTPPLT